VVGVLADTVDLVLRAVDYDVRIVARDAVVIQIDDFLFQDRTFPYADTDPSMILEVVGVVGVIDNLH
jgi:hypothetical protein